MKMKPKTLQPLKGLHEPSEARASSILADIEQSDELIRNIKPGRSRLVKAP